MKRWLKRIGLFVLGVLVLNLSIFMYMHYSTRSKSQAELQAMIAQLDANEPDWQWEALDARRRLDILDEQNAAWLVIQLEKSRPQMPTGSGSADIIISDVISTVRLTPEKQLDEVDTQTLRVALEQSEPAMVFVRKLAQAPQAYFPIIMTPDWISTLFPHIQAYRQGVMFLSAQAYLAMQEGKTSEAAEHVRVMLQTTAAMSDEPTLIAQLVRIVCGAISRNVLERLLAQGEYTDAELATLQRMLDTERNFAHFAAGIRGERAGAHVLLTNMENGTLNLQNLASSIGMGGGGTLSNLFQGLNGWNFRRYLPANHLYLLKLYAQCLELDKLPWWEQPAMMQSISVRPKGYEWLLVHLLAPAIEKIHQAQMRTRAQLTTAMVAVACERYRMKHGAWPKSVEELMPAFLADRPRDAYTGRPIMIATHKEGISVYSTGPDGIDDGGIIWRDGATPGTDYGMQLWDVKFRRQPAPPREPEKLEVMPHTPGEEEGDIEP